MEFIVIQPNIDPYKEKYLITNEKITHNLINMIKKGVTKKTSFIITPETTLPGNKNIYMNNIRKDKNMYLIKKFIKKYPKTILLLGIELHYKEKNKINNKNIDVFNSIIQIDNTNVLQIYHKHKLVPGVEIFPYKKILKPIIGEFLLNFGGSTLERKYKIKPILLNKNSKLIKIASIICYESIFGEYVSKIVNKGANYICIHTNDSWWGNSEGYKQHLSYSRLRAIENRRSIARSANTGISCFINQKGDIINYIPYNNKNLLKCKLLSNNKKTFYTKNGDLISYIALYICSIIIFIYIYVYIKILFKYY